MNTVKDGWVLCPICHSKTRTRIRPNTKASDLPVWCPHCKNETIMNIDNGDARASR